MLQRDTSNLPEGFFNAFSQRLKRFAETQAGGLGVGVSQDKMIEQMRERLPGDRHFQVLHVGEIGLGTLSWGMALFKDHLLLRSMQCSPPGDMPAQRAILCGTVATRMLF